MDQTISATSSATLASDKQQPVLQPDTDLLPPTTLVLDEHGCIRLKNTSQEFLPPLQYTLDINILDVEAPYTRASRPVISAIHLPRPGRIRLQAPTTLYHLSCSGVQEEGLEYFLVAEDAAAPNLPETMQLASAPTPTGPPDLVHLEALDHSRTIGTTRFPRRKGSAAAARPPTSGFSMGKTLPLGAYRYFTGAAAASGVQKQPTLHVATETNGVAGRSDREPELHIKRPLGRGDRDWLVGIWCLRLWRETVEAQAEKEKFESECNWVEAQLRLKMMNERNGHLADAEMRMKERCDNGRAAKLRIEAEIDRAYMELSETVSIHLGD